jgi:hypothetical protein
MYWTISNLFDETESCGGADRLDRTNKLGIMLVVVGGSLVSMALGDEIFNAFGVNQKSLPNLASAYDHNTRYRYLCYCTYITEQKDCIYDNDSI